MSAALLLSPALLCLGFLHGASSFAQAPVFFFLFFRISVSGSSSSACCNGISSSSLLHLNKEKPRAIPEISDHASSHNAGKSLIAWQDRLRLGRGDLLQVLQHLNYFWSCTPTYMVQYVQASGDSLIQNICCSRTLGGSSLPLPVGKLAASLSFSFCRMPFSRSFKGGSLSIHLAQTRNRQS